MPSRDDEAIDISRDGAHRHQHIHIGLPVTQRSAAAADILPAQQKHDRRGQRAEDEEPDVLRQKSEVVHQERDLVQEMARHAEDGQRDGEEDGADLDESGLALDLGLAGGRFLVFGSICGCVDDAIAGAFDGGGQIPAARQAGQVRHGRLFAGEIDIWR